MTEKEDIASIALVEFLNAVEAGIASARQIIKEAKIGWDPNQIKWEETQGTSGPYQRSEDVNNPEKRFWTVPSSEINSKQSLFAYLSYVGRFFI